MLRLTSTLSAAGAAVALTLTFVSSAGAHSARNEPADGQPTVRLGAPEAHPVPPEIVGANHRWLHDGLGMWDPSTGQADPTIVDMSRQVGLRLVRYPGGTIANLFHWKRAIGPQEDRGCQTGAGFVGQGFAPVDSAYGVDEHQQYVAKIGAETEMMMQSTTATPQEAADFVEYMNAPLGTNPNGGVAWAQRRAANGHPAPYHITRWEVGNEPYLGNQRYWRSTDTDTAMREYAFGGTERQVGEPMGKGCDHRASVVSDGTAGQQFSVRYPSVVPGSQQVSVGGQLWQPVADLSTAGADDHVYAFDATTGTATFGDGTHGAVPPTGSAVTADYDSGQHPGFVDFYSAMKKADPRIDVCASWATVDFVDLMGNRPYDCLGVHQYGKPDKTGTPQQLYDRLVPSASGVTDKLGDLQDAIREDRGPLHQPYLAVSEYGTLGGGPGAGFTGWAGSLMQAEFSAELTMGFIEHDVRYAEISNLNAGAPNYGNLFGGAPDFTYTARAHALALFGKLAGGQPVATQTTDNPQAAGGYPALRVLGVRQSAHRVQLIVVNRDPTNAVTPRILADGLQGRLRVRLSTVSAASFQDYNSPDQPDAVTTHTSQSTSRGAVALPLPAHSVNLLDITAARP